MGKLINESKFKKGEINEVSSEHEGFENAWFVATIVDTIKKNKV